MHKNILLISDNKKDFTLFDQILKTQGFTISQIPFDDNIDKKILDNNFSLILADYDIIRHRADFFYEMQKGRSKACIIFYGGNFEVEEVNQILHNGIYTVIPRDFLTERIRDAIVGGLENRRAFIEILGMMEELRIVNDRLEEERNTLKKKNQELNFINSLSREISYDLNWDRIMSRMMDAGLKDILYYFLFGIFYRMGSTWNLALHITERGEIIDEEGFKSEIFSHIYTCERGEISPEEIQLQIISPQGDGEGFSFPLDRLEVSPLTLAGRSLGSVFFIPEPADQKNDHVKELMDTLANILSLSLKNAQEYHKLKEAAVTDSLTGIYNRKGLYDFLNMEVHRSRRYDKALSFVMIDMDNFKSINDSMGHQAGDYVLRELAGILKSSIRKPDVVARYGGDEFALLLPEATIEEAEIIMERVSRKTETHTFEWGSGRTKARMSYGISNVVELEEGQTLEDLVRLADSRLYTAKHS